MRNRNEKTICAISTPPGLGGIAVIRVSGPEALDKCFQIAPNLKNKKIVSHNVYLTKIIDQTNVVIDEVLVTYFSVGRSFTGEEVVEISCHGSEYISQRILELLLDAGCSMAEKGEFTFRAFMNNKIDLVQAESVLSVIQSQDKVSARVAVRQLEGHISKQFEFIESELTWCLAHIEASIDFSTEGIDVVDSNELLEKLESVRQKLTSLVESYKSGRLVKDGIKLVFLGNPNVGKSSLLNLLLQDDKAIVTPIAGTTRDVIQGITVFNGIRFNISDTAGLRETSDIVEKIGVDRSEKEADRADAILYILDCNEPDFIALENCLNKFKTNIIVICNKLDLINGEKQRDISNKLSSLKERLDFEMIFTSNIDTNVRSSILSLTVNKFKDVNVLDDAIVTSSRQYEMCKQSLEMLDVSLLELQKNLGAEFIAMYLKESLLSIQRILGHVFDDQIMDRVFKEFCIGK